MSIFAATTKQNYDLVTMTAKIDAVSRSIGDASLNHATTNRLSITEIAECDPSDSHTYTSTCFSVG